MTLSQDITTARYLFRMGSFSAVWDSVLELLKYHYKAPMIFSSGLFFIFFLVFSFFYQFMRRTVMLRIVYVVLFSLYFYYKSSGIYVSLLLFVSFSDYAIARLMHSSPTLRQRRFFLVLSITINLGLLAYFKYTNFFIGIANDLFGQGFLDFRNIFLPIGISFFLFQSMSYTIDIYRGRTEPLRNPLDYIFYLSFFPLLLAGPIIRARDFIPQIRQNPVVVTRNMFGMGIFLIAAGLFKKAIISDYISLNFVDRVFDNPMLYSGFENLMGVYGYAMQIYCDFSGYSDMALGFALLMGLSFAPNFDSPYKSATITEFWRRWHISLSTWLKDYLYISLGGNRKGNTRTYVNLLITMLLGGLWHGAAMRFILWGGLHGGALAIHKFMMNRFPGFKATGMEMSRGRRILGILITFHLVCFGWIFFRAKDMSTAGMVLDQIFTNFNPALISQVLEGYAPALFLIVLGFVLHFTSERTERRAERFVIDAPIVVKALILVTIIWVVMQIKSADIQPFIYFQF